MLPLPNVTFLKLMESPDKVVLLAETRLNTDHAVRPPEKSLEKERTPNQEVGGWVGSQSRTTVDEIGNG
ncbi:hypothetical protein EVAR_62846_1 [Eumeta japonica]|uniref:Uncharacterized protein n=1 Tax=Eumeta variegata TaxID=151549 RepID=A0A4C1ZGZ3_EUMVA|nr:hypothetical protein EVAR_62846_1 [Eumeta japonica]